MCIYIYVCMYIYIYTHTYIICTPYINMFSYQSSLSFSTLGSGVSWCTPCLRPACKSCRMDPPSGEKLQNPKENYVETMQKLPSGKLT